MASNTKIVRQKRGMRDEKKRKRRLKKMLARMKKAAREGYLSFG